MDPRQWQFRAVAGIWDCRDMEMGENKGQMMKLCDQPGRAEAVLDLGVFAEWF